MASTHKLFYGIIFASTFGFAQVGINTETPRATLHIEKNAQSSDSSTGIIIPRVSTNPSTGNEQGQLIFNTNHNSFYFWDGTKWMPISSQSGTPTVNSNLNAKFADSRNSNGVTITNSSKEAVIPGAKIEFSLTKKTPVQFYSTANFKGTSSAFSPLFKLKLTKSDGTTEIIDQSSNTFLSDGISQFLGNLPLMTIKELQAGNYSVEVVAYYNTCCGFDFTYSTGGNDTPVSVLIQYP